MVNKAALGVVAIIVVVVLGGGLLLGSLLEGSGGSDTDGPADGPNDGSTPAPGNATEELNSDQGGDVDSTRTPMLPRRFNRSDIAENVTRLINEYRANQSVDDLSTEGKTAAAVQTMAQEHSVAMADAGRVDHVIAGTNVSDRYRDHDLTETCKYSDGLNAISPGYQNVFEVVAAGSAGTYYEDNTSATFIDTERAAAELIVEDLLADAEIRERVTNDHFSKIGTGVEITRENEVYVTMNFCS